MKQQTMNQLGYKEIEADAEFETFERIKRRKPAKDLELREKGRKRNHRTKKKKDI